MAYRLPLLQKMAHREGTWERINRAIRERLRVRLKRDPQPSAGVVDSQGRSKAPRWAQKSAATTEERRSRGVYAPYLLVDTEGFVLKAKLHSALKVMDSEKGSRRHCLMGQRYAISSPPSSVGGCRLPRGGEGRRDWVRKSLGWSVDVLERPKKPAPEEVL